MSHTLHLSWPHALAVHAPATPHWLTNAEHAIGNAVHRLGEEHPIYDTHVEYIEDALMAREMYRL
ncbi:hypothetical protein EB75_17525 [Mycobacterium sp. ST-F2]|uniref:hypothetical protein n=1 Tax=Mycobacterium sp. ST-F2 TaxID=1490484 RepID=UPI0009403E0A|nr:hypothetical protein [Mycobacterium sp. ST-F2]OKH81276.1 hypothetical protein EB75_17525 [Mycobacterium sp. ST-F2]